MQRRWGWVALVAIVGVMGCGGPDPEGPDSGEATDGGGDPTDGGGTDGADGAGLCCPIDIHAGTPCGCWRIGGYAPTLAACRQHCDGTNYSERTDEHGCAVLDYYGFGSCLPEPDAGHAAEDAGVSSDAEVADDDAGVSTP